MTDQEKKRVQTAKRVTALRQRNDLLDRKRRDYALTRAEHTAVKQFIRQIRSPDESD